ncbi:methyltransferase [Spirillospora sp. CA-294931]|uniref:methyltransferase n=1 Tax=Spirillospora sp. CA-294931 TaxID=3240042 RepID=UPI003D8DD746
MAEASVRSTFLDMVFGYMPAQIIQVAAKLRIADLLAGGARTSGELAGEVGAHGPSLYRLLRALAALGAVTEVEHDRFELTADGARLREDAPDSIRGLVMLFCGDEVWASWGDLVHSVRTGEPAWDKVTGMSPFEFLATRPEQSATFNAAMAEHTRDVAPQLVEAYDFARFGTLADLGGGDGTLIASILAAVPAMRGVLFDLPAGAEGADATLKAAGVADRCRVVPGDFFASVPSGQDAYLLKSVIHDWDDERAAAILKRCREAVSRDGTLLVVEPVLPPVAGAESRGTVMSDINMLVATGGRERTEAEFRALLTASGFAVTSIGDPIPSGYRVIEAAPA